MTWSIRLSSGILMYLGLIFKWSEHLLSLWPLWMQARLINAHDAPKQLWVSNMIQRVVPDSLVAAACLLIISREPKRCRGSGGLRQHERYRSLAFRRHRVAGPFRGHLWHHGFSLMQRRLVPCVFYFTCTHLALICKWTLSWTKQFHTQHLKRERQNCVTAGLNSCSLFHTIQSVCWKHCGQDLSFSNQWHQFQ